MGSSCQSQVLLLANGIVVSFHSLSFTLVFEKALERKDRTKCRCLVNPRFSFWRKALLFRFTH